MKNALIVFCLVVLVFVVWLAFRQPKITPITPSLVPTVSQPTSVPTTNAPISTQTSANLSPAPLFPAPSENIPVRPAMVDEDTWHRWLTYRQMILDEDQPVEFCVRVVDQNNQPVTAAKLRLKLGRIEGMAFATTNFSAWDPAKAMREISFEAFSDSNGWIQITGTNGFFVEIWGLVKDGYSFSYRDGNFGGVHYEPHGVRTILGNDILMTNAWNPQKGYILHLQKIEETNSVNSAK
jgi:hypothetical protein